MILVLFTGILSLLSSCEKEPIETEVNEFILKSTSEQPEHACGETSFDLWAGQTMKSGLITISNDEENIFIEITTKDGWQLQQTHLHLGSTYQDIPKNKSGVPVPGHFTYNTLHLPLVTTYTYTVPNNRSIGDEIIIAIHAEVVKTDKSGEIIGEETAWAGNIEGPSSRWWFYLSFTMAECEDEICYKYQDETAWAGTLKDVTPWFAIIELDETQTAKDQPLWAGKYLRTGTVYVRPDALNPGMLKITVRLAEDVFLQEGDNWFIQGYYAMPTSRPVSEDMTYKGSEHWREFVKRIPAENVNFVAVQINISIQIEIPCE
ncbi:hypothetical protein JCM15548_12040 [Geofilum rubicundum JCM 15548]|uniref:Uncharacterized protein n=1 Tax=Geofilum rubicundum JCM 15548 TaxID=1236989 RepID=A0A0E9LW41_9BACT|nr:hypothetical protein JCM15548_12040 [Geofilum rubicundum JCM 15548]